ncbi:MAG TPA: ankyrin repeat domain-containing protein [Rhodanobacteraceae bacterium]
MFQAKSHRRPSLSRSLPCFLPSLVAVFLAIWIPPAWERYSLLLLLISASLSMAAVCYAMGFGCEPTFTRTALRRGSAHLIALVIHTAIVFILIAWPLMMLSQAPSLTATLGLCVALVIALIVLWRAWPVFGLVFEWDDAFPAGEEHSWITTALARSFSFARHLTRGRDLFLTHFLPASLAQLAIAFCALSLAGVGANLPDEIRTAALFLFAVVVLPVCSLIVANRTFRLLFDARTRPMSPTPAPLPPRRSTPDDEMRIEDASEPSAALDDAPTSMSSAAQSNAPAQAVLDANLLAAAREGNVRAALDWLMRGANPDAAPAAGAHDQRSALVLAAELPDTRLLRALIGKGADVNRAYAGLTPLLATTRACHAGRPEMVTSLVANGADPARADADGNTPLHHAALCAEPAVAAILIDAQAPLEARNREQATPLAVAAEAANWPVLRFLVERGAHVDAALPAAARTANDDAEGVRVLLKHKAHVNAVDALGRSALLHAAGENHIEIARTLLDANADANLADRYGTTPLMEAARAGATGIVSLLAEKQPDVHVADQHGRTALMLACQSPRANAGCVRALLEMGADPARKGGDGRSAIDQASAAGRWDLVSLMDPQAAVPASHAQASQPEAGADTPQHLLDALRFAHWSVVARFEERARIWPATELAALYLDLADHADAAPRAWLLEHGLHAEESLGDGTRLFDALLDRLPASRAAVSQLLDAGATPAGAGLLARALARLDDAEASTALALAMLERGADAFGVDADERTPLHHASHPARQALLDALLARGADPNARDRAGATPLHVALNAEPDAALPLVKALIARGADPESAAASGETPLGVALARDATKLEYWLRWNGWPLPRRPLRNEDLPAAAADPDAVARLLELGLPVDSRDARGATALLRASGAGALQSVQRLLAANADPKLTVDSGASALSAAVSARQPDIARALVAAGVPVDQPHADGVTALMIAAALGHAEMAAVLRELGAKPELADSRGQTALHAVARFCFDSRDSLRCRRLLDALLRDAPHANTADKTGATPLLVLLGVHAKPGTECDGTHLGALVPVLLGAGATVEHADEHGVTALHACAMHALFEPARVLLQHGADREARDCMQRTPADLARVLGYIDLAMELTPRRSVQPSQPIVTPMMTHPE